MMMYVCVYIGGFYMKKFILKLVRAVDNLVLKIDKAVDKIQNKIDKIKF